MNFNILIVDDSATTRSVIKRTISMANVPAVLHEAADGQAGLDVLASRQIDLVLADLHMPRMGGIEMIRRLRSNPATCSTPVLVITAESSNRQLEELKRECACGYLRKPFTPESIRDAITDLLGAHNA